MRRSALHVGLHRGFSFTSFQKGCRLGAPWIFRERRSAPAVPAFVFPPPLQKVACTPLPGSLGCGVPAPDAPFCLYLSLCGCKALPAVWVRLKAATTDWMMFLSLHVSKSPVAFAFRDATQPARESRLCAPGQFRVRRSGLIGRQLELQTFRQHCFCFWEPLGADGRSPRKILRRDQTGRVNLGARRHNACYV